MEQAVTMANNKTSSSITAGDVLLYIPNIIGYLRVICTVLSLIFMFCYPQRWIVAITLYVLSFVGDLFDGLAARKFDQCSTFGGLLDMVTDRCSTTGLLCVLSNEHSEQPLLVLLFTMLIILDISSHWCQMYFTASFKQHHKSTEGNLNSFALVRWYYSYYYFFGYCCVGTEFTYVAIYILARLNALNQFETIRIGCEYFLMIAIPACITKQIVNVSQLCSACHAVAMHDAAQKNK